MVEVVVMRAVVALTIFLGLSIGNAQSAAPSSVTKWPRWTQFGDYEPLSPTSLSDIPKPIRTRLIAHLEARLGENLYRRLRFTGGQVVDFAELRRREPDSKDYQWEVHAYDLHFELRMPEAGIDSYTAQIELRRDGSVLEEIDLPDLGAHPERIHIISLSDALAIATARGFEPGRATIAVDYDVTSDSIVWKISQIASDDGLVTTYKNMDIRAQDGHVARIYATHGIR